MSQCDISTSLSDPKFQLLKLVSPSKTASAIQGKYIEHPTRVGPPDLKTSTQIIAKLWGLERDEITFRVSTNCIRQSSHILNDEFHNFGFSRGSILLLF